ncbi:hypothetical protein SacmaDRAFT_4217 [Saccharomonospora marina XMU15]|uniref:Uncharacterized protein n=1 Tax=Saccharomonospora marina XMU15 TaxID=882083 RepID=H5X6Y0_9PSEU|nr:hypothetical protein [Saccharomonospora marina]EHR52410.1 hypothetical protein SacmaDRAFT_4217 [Saccharomonospora marina XMU15]
MPKAAPDLLAIASALLPGVRLDDAFTFFDDAECALFAGKSLLDALDHLRPADPLVAAPALVGRHGMGVLVRLTAVGPVHLLTSADSGVPCLRRLILAVTASPPRPNGFIASSVGTYSDMSGGANGVDHTVVGGVVAGAGAIVPTPGPA